jgi:hypothetical protein
LLYLLAAKYIFGGSQFPAMVSKLSGTTKNLTAGLMADPQKMENLISMVRTVAPLTSTQTVSKINTYLPLFEKVSTLLGLYSFLNKAQTFRPIEPLNTKTPQDMLAALMRSNNMPISKMLAQPLLANNMDKIIGAVASSMLKNGGLNDMLKNGNFNDMLNNENLNQMLSAFNGKGKGPSDIDLNGLMEAFMPIISSMSSNSSNEKDDEYNNDDHSYKSRTYDEPQKIELISENDLPDDVSEKIEESSYEEDYEKYYGDKNTKFDRSYKRERYNNYEKSIDYEEHRSNYEKKDIQRPIRIKQRKRR